MLDQFVLGGFFCPPCADHVAAPHDGHAVAHRHHFRQLVRHDQNAVPFGRKSTQRHAERGNFLRRQDGGRLVQNENLCAAHERLQDFDALLLADREVRNPRIEIDVDAVALTEFRDLGATASVARGKSARQWRCR